MERFSDRLLSLFRKRPRSTREFVERLGLSRGLLNRALEALQAGRHPTEEGLEVPCPFLEPLTEAAVRAALSPQHRFGAVLEVHPVVDSTNDLAKALAAAGAPEGTVVIADQQTQGRGRLGRPWFSPPRSHTPPGTGPPRSASTACCTPCQRQT